MPRALSSGQNLLIQFASLVTWADGVCHPHSPSPHGGVPVLGSRMWTGKSARFYSLRSAYASLGIDALAHVWPHKLLYAFPLLALIPLTSSRVSSPTLACYALAGRAISAVAGSALAVAAAPGPAVAGRRDGLPSAPGAFAAVGLVPEWLNLSAGELSP